MQWFGMGDIYCFGQVFVCVEYVQQVEDCQYYEDVVLAGEDQYQVVDERSEDGCQVKYQYQY